MLLLEELTLYQQLLFVATTDPYINVTLEGPPEFLKYHSRFTVTDDDNKVTFIRTNQQDTVDVAFEFNTDPHIETFVKVTTAVKITVKGTLIEALAELRHFIHRDVMPTSYSKVSNVPTPPIRKLIESAQKYQGREISGDRKENWDINITQMVRLDKIFTAITKVMREEPGMAWLIENHALIIDSRGTDMVFIEIQNRTETAHISFTCVDIKDEFDFYIQLHKTIKQQYPNNPLFRCTMDAFNEWEEAMFTAIKAVTGLSPYQSVVKATEKLKCPPMNTQEPACIYGQQIFISGE